MKRTNNNGKRERKDQPDEVLQFLTMLEKEGFQIGNAPDAPEGFVGFAVIAPQEMPKYVLVEREELQTMISDAVVSAFETTAKTKHRPSVRECEQFAERAVGICIASGRIFPVNISDDDVEMLRAERS